MATIGTRTGQLLATIEPEFEKVVRTALKLAPPWLDFSVISARRTAEEQHELWQRGRDEQGEIVDESKVVTYCDGYEKPSNHQDRDGNGRGEAIDIAAFIGGRPNWDEQAVAIRAAYIIGVGKAMGVNLTGGVEWGWDLGHIEMEQRCDT